MKHYAVDENYVKGRGNSIEEFDWKRVDGEVVKIADMSDDQVITIWQSLACLERDSLNHTIRIMQSNNIPVGTQEPTKFMSEADKLEFDVEVTNYQYAQKWKPYFEAEIRDVRKQPGVLVI